jgi:two-component system, cell cycle sensor histidine kinase and response regulator CckA
LRFTFRASNQVVVKPTLVSPAKQPSGGSETILVVEDDSSLRWLTCQILAQFGYAVLEAQDASHALALARERAGDIGLVITDVIMPGHNGRKLARRIRELYPHTRVLLMSGHMAEIAQLNENEIDLPFLEKPFTPEDLALKVREVLDEEEDSSRLRKGA